MGALLISLSGLIILYFILGSKVVFTIVSTWLVKIGRNKLTLYGILALVVPIMFAESLKVLIFILK